MILVSTPAAQLYTQLDRGSADMPTASPDRVCTATGICKEIEGICN